MIFRQLSPAEEKEFRQWARENYPVGGEINEMWHPVVRSECERINREQSHFLPLIEVGIAHYEYACPECDYYWTMHKVPDVVTCPNCHLPFQTGLVGG